jgi:carbamoyl-phosphate synthase large subunit
MKITLMIPSGAGAPGFAGILNCLRKSPGIRVIAGDMDSMAYGRQLADEFFQTPPSNHPEYSEFVLQKAKECCAEVVLPITTRELNPLSENLNHFLSNGIKLLISSPESLRVANNKARLYEHMQANGQTTPAFRIADNLNAMMLAIEELSSDGQRLIFKPAAGNGSVGFGVILGISEALQRNVLHEKPGNSYYYNREDLRNLLPENFGMELMVSEYLPGSEFSVDVMADRGRTIYAITRSREKMVSGISVKGTFIQRDDIFDVVRYLVKSLDLHGPIGLQFRENSRGEMKILEINPRLQGTVSSCLGAGINVPLDAVRIALDEPVEGSQDQIQWGVGFVRYWSEAFFRPNGNS